MNKPFFKIETPGLSADALMAEINASIAQKTAKGVYDTINLEDQSDFDVLAIKDESQFLDYYLKAIQKSWAIDINDFAIPRKAGWLGGLEKMTKTIIWKCLKFYTYRLFSQQREFNSQASHAILAMHQDFQKQYDTLRADLATIRPKPDPS